MSPIEVCSVAALAFALLRFGVQPLLARKVAVDGAKASMATIGLWGSVECLTSFMLLLAASAGLVAIALTVLSGLISHNVTTFDVANLDRWLERVRNIYDFVHDLHGFLALLLIVSCCGGMMYLSARARRTQVSGLIEQERGAQFRQITEKFKAGELEELPPTEMMQRVAAEAESVDRQATIISKAIASGQHATNDDNRTLEALRRRLSDLSRMYLFLDFDRRTNVKVDLSRLTYQGPQEGLRMYGTLAVSSGMLGALGTINRIVFVATSLLFVPGSIAFVGSSAGAQTVVASVLDRLESARVDFARKDAIDNFTKSADVAEAAQDAPAPKSDSEDVDESSMDWCTAKTSQCDDVVLNRLSMSFERAYAHSAYDRAGGKAASVEAENRPSLLHNLSNEASARHVSTGTDFVQVSSGKASGDKALVMEALALTDPSHSTPIREQFRKFLVTELVENRPSAWQTLKSRLAVEAPALRTLPGRIPLRQGLVLRAVAIGLSTAAHVGGFDADFDRIMHAPQAADSLHQPSFEIQANGYVASLINGDGTDLAASHLTAMSDTRAGYRSSEIDYLQHLTPRIDSEAGRIANSLVIRPATLSRLSDVPSNQRVDDLMKALVMPTANRPSEPKLSSYDGFFPPPSAGGAPGAGPSGPDRGPGGPDFRPRPGGWSNAFSFARMNSSPKVGGVVIGRPPENAGEILDFSNIAWKTSGASIELILTRTDGGIVRVGPVSSQIINLALAYVADGRVVPATVLNDAVLSDQRVLLNPAFLDTALGCRMLAIDVYVFDLTDGDSSVAAALEQVRNFEPIYRLAWVERAKDILDAFDIDARSARKWPINRNALVSRLENAESSVPDDSEMAAKIASLGKEALAFAHAKTEFFDAPLVAAIERCTLDKDEKLDGVRSCLRGAAAPLVSAIRDGSSQPIVDAMSSPPPRYALVSGVREARWTLTPSLDFAQNDHPRTPLDQISPPLGAFSPLDFSIQVQFETAPIQLSSKGRRASSDDASRDQDVAFDEQSWQFPSIADRVRRAVSTIANDAERRAEFGPVEDLTRVQRLFRAAVDGRLGKSFPAHKLVALERASAGSIKEMRTPRWKPFPGRLEIGYLTSLKSFAAEHGAQHSNISARAASCMALSNPSSEDLASAWKDEARISPLAAVPSDKWEESCVVTEEDLGKDESLYYFANYAEGVAKKRQLRALVLDTENQADRRLGPKGNGYCAPM
jgi:hypothetical protein